MRITIASPGLHRARSMSLTCSKSARRQDPPPRRAIYHARALARGEVTMIQARAAGGHAIAAARDLRGAARHAGFAAGQVAVVAHVAAHELGGPRLCDQ